jgi:outer membrane protein assembly factor BamB
VTRALLPLLLLAGTSYAKDFAPRADLEIVALDDATGALRWAHTGTALGNAHFELYPKLLVAYPHYDQHDHSSPIFLDPATGKTTPDSRAQTSVLVARSWSQWPDAPVVLANGWELTGFRQGDTKDLTFEHEGAVMWTVHPLEYPEHVLAFKNLALYAYGYLTNQAMIFAQEAGAAKPAWKIDFNAVLKPPTRASRVAMQLLDGTLFAQVDAHVFAIAPATGKIAWSTDVAAAAGLHYTPDLFGGASDCAVFARDKNVLVVSYENRVLALSATSGKLLWSLPPDTFPHTAFPLARDGIVYLIAGPKRGTAVRPGSR